MSSDDPLPPLPPLSFLVDPPRVLFHQAPPIDPYFVPYEEIGELIPDELIPFGDERLYHTIPMYKTLLSYHMGLTMRNITNQKYFIEDEYDNQFVTIQPDGLFFPSFPKREQVTNYTQCSIPVSIHFPLKDSFPFEHMVITKTFLAGTNNSFIHIVRRGLTLFFLFPVGSRETIETITNYEIFNYNEIMKKVHSILPTITQIVCCGHSAGMSSAIVFSFLLLCSQQPVFLQKHHSLFSKSEDYLSLFQNSTSVLRDKKIYVVGTGGAPVLFTFSSFRSYYEALQGRYVHVLSALKTDRTFYIDKSARINHNIRNIKFAVYYTPDIYYNDQDKTIFGSPCAQGTFISTFLDDEIQAHMSTLCEKKEEEEDVNEYLSTKIVLPSYQAKLQCNDIMKQLHAFTTYRTMLSIYLFDQSISLLGQKKKNKKNNKMSTTSRQNKNRKNTSKKKKTHTTKTIQ